MSTTSGPDIETPHELTLTRRLAATPGQVWAAWTRPDLFAQWWVGPGFRTHDLTLDARTGGRFSAHQSTPDGSMCLAFDGYYRAADAPRKLVIALGDGERAEDPARTEMTITLHAVGGETEQEFRQTGVITDEHFEQLKAGTEMFFDQLAALLASR